MFRASLFLYGFSLLPGKPPGRSLWSLDGSPNAEFRAIRIYPIIGVRGSPERDISSLRAVGPGGRQVLRVVRAACALFDVFEEK